MWLLDASLADNEFSPRWVGGKGISVGTMLVGAVAFKLVLNGFKAKPPRNW